MLFNKLKCHVCIPVYRSLVDEESVGAVYYDNLHNMLPCCDYVVVSCPLTPDTGHLISHKQLSLMKNTATIVNVARGKWQ